LKNCYIVVKTIITQLLNNFKRLLKDCWTIVERMLHDC